MQETIEKPFNKWIKQKQKCTLESSSFFVVAVAIVAMFKEEDIS